MKKLGVFAGVTLALLVALMVYALVILGQYSDLEETLAEDYVAASTKLQELDKRFPDPNAKTIDAKRFAVWLEARGGMAELLTEAFKDPEKVSGFQVRKTRNKALARLADLLDQRSMGIGEYDAISTRWHTILARPEFTAAQDKWRAIVRTQSTPEGMPLPEPAKDATPEELALIRKHLARLIETMDADKLSILIGMIARGETPESIGTN